MATEKTKKGWVSESAKALEVLLTSEEETVFDAHLFKPMELASIFGRLNVKTQLTDCDYFNRIRASRLKMLGYEWSYETKEWVYVKEGEESE